MAHTTLSLFTSDYTAGKAPPSSPGFQAIRACRVTRSLTNWRKQLPPPLTRHHDPSNLPPRKPSSDGSPPIHRKTVPVRPWCTKIYVGRQTVSPPQIGQMPFSKPKFPSLGQLAGVGACVRADVLLCVHSHARRHNSEREKNIHRSAINHAAPRI